MVENLELELTGTPTPEPLLDRPSSDEEDSNDKPNIVTRQRKSILQPSAGKYSRKAVGRRRDVAVPQQAHDIEADENDEEYASLEDSPITTIRTAEELELLTNPPSKKYSDAASCPAFLPRKYLELSVVKYDLPPAKPQGPGDLWTCTFESCFHRVHEASTPHGKKRVQEHFKIHAIQAQEKIDLALNESRPYLPVK